MFLCNNKTSFNSAAVKSSSNNSPPPTTSFKFWANLFTKQVIFNNFFKLLYLSQPIPQQIFHSTSTEENTGAIDVSLISWFKPKAPQSLLNSDLGHTSSLHIKNDWPVDHNTSSNFNFFVISCSNVCRITISWYITPTSTFSLISDTRFSNKIFHFSIVDLTQCKATFESDQLKTFEILKTFDILTWRDNAIPTETIKAKINWFCSQ